MKKNALELIEIFSSNAVGSYSLNLYYNHSVSDDDTKFEARESLIISFRETNSQPNIEISIEIPFCMNLLDGTDGKSTNLSSGSILSFIKDHFAETIPLIIYNDYSTLSRLIRTNELYQSKNY